MNKSTGNIKISEELFSRIIALLEYWDVYSYDIAIQDDYHHVMNELMDKRERLDLRGLYAKIIKAKDDDARHEARIDYLRHARRLNG